MHILRTTRYLASIVAVALLAGCSAQSATPPTAGRMAGNEATANNSSDACPCLYVANEGAGDQGSVTVYGSGATGNAAPVQYIHGSKTKLIEAWGLAVDPERNIYVANPGGGYKGRGSVVVFAAGADGNVAPKQIITGPATGLLFPFWVAVSPITGEIYVETEGSGCYIDGGICVLVFASGANGNTSPIGAIDGPYTGLGAISGLATDANGSIYVGNSNAGSNIKGSITVYAAGSLGNVFPTQTIAGSKTELDAPQEIAVDHSNNIYVDNYGQSGIEGQSVTVYRAESNGNVKPMQTIAGNKTKLGVNSGIAVDNKDQIYLSGSGGDIFPNATDWVMVYAAGAHGNVGPIYKIAGNRTKLDYANGIAIR